MHINIAHKIPVLQSTEKNIVTPAMGNPQTDGHICGLQEFSNIINLCSPIRMRELPFSDLVTTACTVKFGCNGIHTYFMGKHHTLKTLQWEE
jgi:hypothetical protein